MDVTYEDPADGLQALRERLDLQRCAPVATVWDAARACVTAGCAANDACPAANAASTSSTARALSAEQATRLAESQAVVVALQPTSAAVDAIRALKISRHQVPVLWDCLLWAVALKERLCSQDRIVDLLQIRVIHRILLSVAESSKGSDQAVPDNKVHALTRRNCWFLLLSSLCMNAALDQAISCIATLGVSCRCSST